MSVAPITPGSIKKMEGINRRPVFFVSLSSIGGYSMTVKGENKAPDDDISIKWGSKMMKNVNSSQVNTKLMDPQELAEFKRAARALITVPDQLKCLDDTNLTWVKMPYVKNLFDGDMWKKDAEGGYKVQEDVVKTLLKRFAKTETWEQLGKIIAVDVFNGNGDRFDVNGNWVNQGNLMFQQRMTGVKVIGLDTFESAGQSSNLTQPGDLRRLEVLKGGLQTRSYADKLVAGVEGEITRAMGKGNIDTLRLKTGVFSSVEIAPDSEGFLSAYAEDLERGILTGVSELKTYLMDKKRQYDMQRPASPPPGQRPGGPGPGGPQPNWQNNALNNAPRPGGPPQPNWQNNPFHAPPQQGFTPPAPPPVPGQKQIPAGVLARMAEMGWIPR